MNEVSRCGDPFGERIGCVEELDIAFPKVPHGEYPSRRKQVQLTYQSPGIWIRAWHHGPQQVHQFMMSPGLRSATLPPPDW